MFQQAANSRLTRIIVAILLAFSLSLGVMSSTASAERKKKNSSRKNFVPSQQVGKKLMKIQELAEVEDYAGALEILRPLSEKTRLKKFDRATVYQMMGYMLGAQEKYEEALAAFEVALQVDYLPDTAMQQLKYNLGQLYLGQENYDRALELFEAWLDAAEKPDAQAHFMITIAYAGKEDWASALTHARTTVDLSTSPVENRLRMLLAVEYQNGNIPETLEVLKTLVTLFPKKDYYMQLAFGYSNIGEEEKALAMLELAYQLDYLTKENELTQLTQRYLYHDLPWPAAQVMAKGLKDGTLENTAKNLELYANSLLHAREYQDAIPPLEEAAILAEEGDLYIRLAQVHLEVEDWKKARQALQSGIDKGSLRDVGSAQLLLGVSNYNEKRFKSAKTAFTAAAQEEKSASSAKKWLKHVNRAITDQQNAGG
ncbi:MAG: tetratricopeptide repeat protein [Myxococcota bacterium]|jgi:tetratricopeptide (TPR) repeat protein|nr:tetratricopeptide repeat protein [Myxococcota bacterium]